LVNSPLNGIRPTPRKLRKTLPQRNIGCDELRICATIASDAVTKGQQFG